MNENRCHASYMLDDDGMNNLSNYCDVDEGGVGDIVALEDTPTFRLEWECEYIIIPLVLYLMMMVSWIA